MFASLRIVPLVCIGLGAGLLSPRLAHAEGLPGGAAVDFDGPFLHDGDEEDLTRGNAETVKDYFNFAHCECARTDEAFPERTFAWDLRLRGRTTSIGQPGDIWVGANCDTTDNDQRTRECRNVGTVQEIDSLVRVDRREISLFHLMQPVPTQMECPLRAGDTTTWLAVDTDDDSSYDYFASKKIAIDTEPPNLPTKVTAGPGEGSVLMKWTNPEERSTDTKYYYFLCAAGDQPALAEPSHSLEVETAVSLCGGTKGITYNSSGEDVAPPAWLQGDVRRFVCGRTSRTETSTRLVNLRVGVPYTVAMIAADDARNAVGIFVPTTVTPTSVIDFWEDLHEQGSDAEGGYCIAASTYGDDSSITRALRGFRDDTLARSGLGRWLTQRYYDVSSEVAPWLQGWAPRAVAAVLLAPLVGLALLWHVLTLPGLAALLLGLALMWRRRRALAGRAAGLAEASQPARALRRRAAMAATALVVVVALVSPSSAQSSLDPYWDDEGAASADDPYSVSWHAGIRLGPYTPAIDSQLGTEPGPYEEMFGGYAILPMLDIDYIFLETSLGQIGAGGSIGYMSKTANTFKMDSVPGPGRERTDEENTFRMIPMAATAVFRLTYLDDKLRVPIVPYVRGGLAYYVWWAEAPDGGVASVCREGGVACDENKARGGSLGITGSLGVAVRAENIDFEAASAMREGGILHAGFYAEVQAAKVNDFGVGNKLSVGDITWFAGVDFEF